MHMPFIRTTTNVNLDEAQEKSLREGTAELIKDILGKDPIRMMTAYEGGVHLSRGTGEIHLCGMQVFRRRRLRSI